MVKFQSLNATHPAFADCLRIRIAVFVEEQNVPLSAEHDELDATALHFLALDQHQAVATARVVLKDAGATAKIGRVAVLRASRGQGIGAALMAAIEASAALSSIKTFTLDAQRHAETFYQALGYTSIGDSFMEADIPHIRMEKTKHQK
jgi:predicted GNAT family N-acyltransferase